eukprot:TRINITY_DN8809_c0_g1_i1.p1 TRINITY_DN8809_c0_g1~~TRINITY_DN8809_c0_g1_i1.p1  ORF type:complete len:181 (-),score=53.61 TRINITY_DN8809_c0_g1_i1:168-710(-)
MATKTTTTKTVLPDGTVHTQIKTTSRVVTEVPGSPGEDGVGYVIHDGQVTTVAHGSAAMTEAMEHAGAEEALEADLARISREAAAQRHASFQSAKELVGNEIEGVRFKANCFAEADLMGTTKRSKGEMVQVGLKLGTYKLVKGDVKVTWKTKSWRHHEYTDGKSKKDERLKPLEHQTIKL